MKEKGSDQVHSGLHSKILAEKMKACRSLSKDITGHGLLWFYLSTIADSRKSEVSESLMILHCPHVSV